MPVILAEQIRQAFLSIVASRTSVDPHAAILETTLIRGGVYCGRKFSLLGYSAVWFQEEGQIKLYQPSGHLESTCSVAEFCRISIATDRDQRRAA